MAKSINKLKKSAASKKKRYGIIYFLSDFIETTLLRATTSGEKTDQFTKTVLKFLKQLSVIQDENHSITLSTATGNGILLTYKGKRAIQFRPSQKHMTVSFWNIEVLVKDIVSERKKRKLFQDKKNVNFTDHSYKAYQPELEWILKKIPLRLKPEKFPENSKLEHARNIPGAVREMVLSDFEKNGRVCNGVDGKVKKHKLNKSEPREFDHIYPFAQGGSSGPENVQVLCMNCNRVKHSTAL